MVVLEVEVLSGLLGVCECAGVGLTWGELDSASFSLTELKMNQQSEAGADISSSTMKDELRQIKKTKKKKGKKYSCFVLLFSISFALCFFSLFFAKKM